MFHLMINISPIIIIFFLHHQCIARENLSTFIFAVSGLYSGSA